MKRRSGAPQDGNFGIPYQDYSLILTLPELTESRRLRLDIRPAFTNESTMKFYGIGNATPLPAGVSLRDTEYQRMHPTLSIEARIRLVNRFYLQLGSIYTQNWLTVAPTSLLAQARSSSSPVVRDLVGTFGQHGVELLEAAHQYDSRDNETVTHSGQFHSAVIRGGGIRLQEGQTFVVRGDIAWSPDARPVGAYFAAGEIF